MKAEQLPPQANFADPAAGLRYADGPFQVLREPERWHRRSAMEPRRAAVSGFGFGGVNAHLLVEEWTGVPPKPVAARAPKAPPKLVTVATRDATAPKLRAAEPVAVVGNGRARRPVDGRCARFRNIC